MRQELKQKLDNAPTQAGCYFWKDKNDNIIYVGKAKNIKKRLFQYFNNKGNNRKFKLVENIYDVDYIIVNNENEALVLENNLIKTHKPKYNVLLKENSNYPYIIITNEKDPRIIYTRKFKSFKGKAYGPFPSLEINAYEIYNLLQRLFPFRKCNNVPKRKCIYYDLGQCLGPCINNISNDTYEELKKDLNGVFNNKSKKIIDELRIKEKNAADNLDFENAKYYLDLQNSLKKISQKQFVEFIKNIDIDIIGYFANDEYIVINIFNFYDGKLLSKSEHISKYFNENIEEVVVSYITQYYENNRIPKEIYINVSKDNLALLSNFLGIKIYNSEKSKYKNLILMAIKNAEKYLVDYKLKASYEYDRTLGACDELAKLLNIDNIRRIDMIDNSNIFNQNPVSAIVTFIDGVKNKKFYRKINLEDVDRKSDYDYMIYAIKKRYKNLIKKSDLPDLLIVDGGKPQITAAKNAFHDLGIENIKIIGLKKNRSHKTECIVDENGVDITIQKNTPLFNMLSNIQEEVHRFAITHFREKRLKSQMQLFLDDIKGLGPKTKEKIINIYPNIFSLKDVNVETLSQIVNKKIANEIIEKIKKENI